MNKKTFLGVLMLSILLIVPAVSFSQGVNFAGTWKLDKEKTKVPEPTDGGRRGGGRMGRMMPDEVTITHEKDHFKMSYEMETQRGTMERVTECNIGGKETVTEGRRGTTKTTGKWSDDKKSLIVTTVRSFSGPMGDREMTSTTTFTLSADGKVLTEKMEMEGFRGDPIKMTMIFNKK